MKLLASVLLIAGCLLALPLAASAAVYTVDITEDEPDVLVNGVACLTAGGKCTLRAAIEESNGSTGVRDEIKFASTPFDGQSADTIVPATALPAIKDPVSILGGDCFGEDGPNSPCAGVEGPSGASALTVENANGVVIEGISVTGAQTGINVIDSSKEFTALNDWIGVKLGGAEGGNTTGIFLDPDSDNAVIGGVEPTERNLIGFNAGDGLHILGADDGKVLGNYFGVTPDESAIEPGGTTAAANGKDIEVNSTSVGGFTAEGNRIGGILSPAAAASAKCDGACNVISAGTTAGVDLQGDGGQEAPAAATAILGNFIGLNAAGTGAVPNGTYGVLVGKAQNAVVGGEASDEANYIAGGSFGVSNENGEGFEAIGNVFGSSPSGADLVAPGVGAFVIATNNANPVRVASNVFEMDGGVAVEARFGGTEILSNFIEAAEIGVWTKVGPNAAGGNLIKGNVIGESLANGIWIEDTQNEVFGNAVYQSGEAGILLELPVPLLFPTENLIGGNTTAEQNNINESGGPAIKIVDESGNTEEDSLNEVGRNKGAKNAGLFIDLVGAANTGILPPAFGTAKQSGASGSGAEPNAKIRVFRKKTAEAGELESFLEEATADSSGNWKVTYPGSIPGGTIVAATQTSVEGATSELSTAITATEPSDDGGGKTSKDDKGTKDDKGKAKAKGKDDKGGVPDTRITKGPKKKTHATTVKFKFISTEDGSKFECKLDRQKFKPCKSPKKYKGLKAGKHVFKVRAVKGKNVDPTPAKRKFKILG